ncbi:hypothetical protein SAMN02800687_1292 [Curtobacterium sp. UNCCL20]|nr:hypothetical protein SAMN02800687_1292 [Curtobacterium sp. UNCCL20]
MGGAFNQDWEDEWSSAEEVFASILSGYPEFRRQLLSDLRLIDDSCSGDEIDDLLLNLGSGFSPDIDAGMEAKAWVRSLSARVAASLDG